MNLLKIINSKNLKQLKKRLNKMDNQRDLEELKKLGVEPSYSKEEISNMFNTVTKPSDYLLSLPNFNAREVDKKGIQDKLKGELLYLILSNINPQELKFCEEQKEIDSSLPIDPNLQRVYILIGKIVEKIKR